MKLITKEIQKKLDKAGYHGDVPICKFFNPCGAGTWIIFGQDKEDKDTLSCVADLGIGFVEAGSVSLSELEGVRLPYGLKIERDIHFAPNGRKMNDFLNMENLQGC